MWRKRYGDRSASRMMLQVFWAVVGILFFAMLIGLFLGYLEQMKGGFAQ